MFNWYVSEITSILKYLVSATIQTAIFIFVLSGSKPHDKLCAKLTSTRLLNVIEQASSIAQTSCLEGFHSVLNHFAPEMVHYSFPGMYCRLVSLFYAVPLLLNVKLCSFIKGESGINIISSF